LRLERASDFVQNCPWVVKHLLIGEAKHDVSEFLQMSSAGIIVLNLEGVTPSVNLNDETCPGTTGIGDIAIDWVLPSELETEQLPVPQSSPQRLLRGRWLLSQFLGPFLRG
jgi:hypothetical protein